MAIEQIREDISDMPLEIVLAAAELKGLDGSIFFEALNDRVYAVYPLG